MTDQLSLLPGPPHEGSVGGGIVRAPRVVVDAKVRGLCRRRYPGHPKGCPNYGKRPTCPPAAPMIGEVLDFERPVWIAWNEYDLGAHVERMRATHPAWSDRQLRCVLYWQPSARRQLDLRIATWLEDREGGAELVVVRCPEACGVNVTETMRLAPVSIELEWPPVRIARQVALIGSRPAGREEAG